MLSTSLSLALIGVGHLVGMTVGVAMLIGMVISYGVLLPLYANGHLEGAGDLTDALSTVFKSDVRFIGAGVMAVAAVWTLIKIMGPIVRGMSESLRCLAAQLRTVAHRSTAPSRIFPASGSSFPSSWP